ncbi:PEBP-like protein [Byssothecium circinans]|uniref:PEBP-like protein n=1 Tax=Byssothecium circinans TaxID=147558 RepID=A0A6A5U5F7_9PLEO|nr:PEBP-like protein [Byssothecium circinans]
MAPRTTEILIQEEQDNTTIGHILCTASIPFGSGDDPWLYLPDSRQFDLSREAEQRLVVKCDETRHNHCGFMIDPGSSVLIVVDMQNYFIHLVYRNHAPGLAAVSPTLKVIERCRKEVMAPAVQRGFSKSLGWHIGLGAQLSEGEGRCFFKRTWNAGLYEPLKAAAQPGDLFFDKTWMSGLWSTKEPLHEYLRASQKKTLIFAGVNTDQCVFGTISDAYSWGWDCVMIADCTGTMTEGNAQELTEYNVATNMGFVTNSSTFVESQLILLTVIDDFLPSLTVSVSWGKRTADLGNTIKPKHLQDEPTITLHDSTGSDISATSNLTYVITLTDPDAPSRDNPEWSEMCHWIASNVSLAQKTYSILPMPIFGSQEYGIEDDEVQKGGLNNIVEYKPPGPPEKTGKHRYVFLVFAPKNGTTERLHLSKPEERKHWGTGEERGGVKNWAGKNGLVPVAANFIYAQNDKQ